MLIDQTNLMVFLNDAALNLLERRKRNVSTAIWNVRRNVMNIIPSSVAKTLVKYISHISLAVTLVTRQLI